MKIEAKVVLKEGWSFIMLVICQGFHCICLFLPQPQQPGSMPPPPGPYGYGQLGPPTRPPGPPTGLPGPPTGPLSGPSGPLNLGPPTSAHGSAPGGSIYQQQPLTSQGMMGPPSGPPLGPTGPPSGPTGPPSGPVGPYSQPHSQTQPGQGYPQPPMGQNAVNNMAGDFSKMGINVSFTKIVLFVLVRLVFVICGVLVLIPSVNKILTECFSMQSS